MNTLHSRYKLFFFFVFLLTGGISVHARLRPMRMRPKKGRMMALGVRTRNRQEASKTTLGRKLRARLKRRVELANARKSEMPQGRRVIRRYKPSRLHRDVVYAKTLNQRPSSKKANNQGFGFNVSRVFSGVYLLSTIVGGAYLLYKAWNNTVRTTLPNDDNFSKTLTYKLFVGKANTSSFINYLLWLEKGFHSDALYPWINVLPFPCLLFLSLVSAAVITFVLWTGYNLFIGGKNRVIPASSSQSIHLDINPDLHISTPSAKSPLQEESIKAFIKESIKKGVKEGIERIKQQLENTKDDLKEIKAKLDQKKGRVIHIYPNSVVTESSSNTKEQRVQVVDEDDKDDNTLSQPVDTIAIPIEDEDDQDDFFIDEEGEDNQGIDLDDLNDEDEDDLDDENDEDEDDLDDENDEDEDDLGDEDDKDEDDLGDEDDEDEDDLDDEDDEDEDFAFLSAFSRT